MSYIPQGKPGERRYGSWGGNPNGLSEDPARCVMSIRPNHAYVNCQCARNRGHGLNGEFCKQHAKQHPAQPSPIGIAGAADE